MMEESYCTTDTGPPLALQLLADEVCEEFVRAYRSGGEPPQIEAYLSKVPREAQHHLLRELIAEELVVRRDAGERVEIGDYLTRFANDSTIVETVFRHHRHLFDSSDCCETTPPATATADETTKSPQGPNAESTARLNPAAAHRELSTIDASGDRRLGRFLLLKRLGSGAFGTVYQAHDPQLQRQVALKVARTERLETDGDIEWFFREARAAAQFKHPHIVPVFEVGTEGTHAYIVSALIEGVTLAEQLQKHRYSPPEAVNLILELAQAVHYAHQKGVFHRDIKPANVMIDAYGSSHLMDFGLARRIDGEELRTRPGDVIGTPAYMSPEQARGDGYAVDARSDLYSLSVILYELLTGQRPFSGSVYDVIRQVLDATPLPPRCLNKKIPVDVEAICQKAMAKRSEDRYPSVLHFAEDLRRWELNQPVHARRIDFLTRAGKWMGRNPLTSAAIAASLLVVGTIVVYRQTRPAWLDARVSPVVATAKVQVNGNSVTLDSQGRALVPHAPGRARLTIAAEGFLPVEREVVLVRGQENAVLAAVELTPTFGYTQVTSEPDGATVELLNEHGESVSRGATPFNSPRLPAGKYKARISKELYKTAEQAVQMPSGDRVESARLVKLEPLLENASSFEFMRAVRKRLAQETNFDVVDLPLNEILARLSKQENISIVLDTGAVRDAGISESKQRTYSLQGVPLATVLTEIGRSFDLTYGAEPTVGTKWLIRITTRQKEDRHLFPVVYPVRDLVVDPRYPANKSIDPLVESLTSTVYATTWTDAGGAGNVEKDRDTASLVITQSWRAHVAIDDFLVNMREARLHPTDDPVAIPEDQQTRIAAIQKIIALGGTLIMNELYPDFAVEGIDLKSGKASELDLQVLSVFPHLYRLDVSNCPVRGDFLEKLPENSKLSHLNAAHTRFDDQSVRQLRRLSNLRYLNLGMTRITDDGLTDVAALKGQLTLHLYGTAVTDAGIAKLKSLRIYELNVAGTKITDACATELASLPLLHRLDIGMTAITDVTLRQLGSTRGRYMNQLGLAHTNVTDQGIASIASLNRLWELNLNRTKITDAALEHLKAAKTLSTLNLNETAITNSGLAHLSSSPVRALYLNKTSITDEGLKAFEHMQNLLVLDLRNTRVSADAVGRLRKLLPRTQVFSGATAANAPPKASK